MQEIAGRVAVSCETLTQLLGYDSFVAAVRPLATPLPHSCFLFCILLYLAGPLSALDDVHSSPEPLTRLDDAERQSSRYCGLSSTVPTQRTSFDNYSRQSIPRQSA